MNFGKFLRTSFLQNTAGRLLLNIKERKYHEIAVWSTRKGKRFSNFDFLEETDISKRSISIQKVYLIIHTAQKMKFSIKDFCNKCPEEILNGKLHFLCCVRSEVYLRPCLASMIECLCQNG